MKKLNGVNKFWFCILFIVALLPACKKDIFFSDSKPEVTINGGDGRLNETEILLSADSVYRIATQIIITEGKSLIIEAGTLIKSTSLGGIVIGGGAKIICKGTVESPVIFTQAAFKGGAGSYSYYPATNWNGIQIQGDGTTSSGSLQYVRIEFAGQSSGGYPGSLTLQNVANTTVLENIQVSYSGEAPAFTFIGGDCNAKNLVSYASSAADFYMFRGYRGKLQHILAYRHPYFPARFEPNLAAIRIEDSVTNPVISNVTVLGPSAQTGTSPVYYDSAAGAGAIRTAIIVNSRARFQISNAVFMGFPIGSFYLDSQESALALAENKSSLTYSILHSVNPDKVVYLPSNLFVGYDSKNLKDYLLQEKFHNRIFSTVSDFSFSDPFNYDVSPNPFPQNNSILLTGADFSGPYFDSNFFKRVSYIGALGTENWLNGWTNFLPLQTNYNN
jgi:hypothetical protein